METKETKVPEKRPERPKARCKWCEFIWIVLVMYYVYKSHHGGIF